MDKQSKRINGATIKFVNKTYEALSVLKTHRDDIRYFNYDHNDELIDENIERMYELLDDMYHKSIEKKAKSVIRKSDLKPNKLVFHDCNTDPGTPKPVRNKIKVEIIDDEQEEKNVLETIMYSSDEDNSSDEEDDWKELIHLSKLEESRLDKELSSIRKDIAEYEGRGSDEEFEKVNDTTIQD